MKIKLGIMAGLLLIGFLSSGGCTSGQSLDHHLSSIVKPYKFSILRWEFETIPRETVQRLLDKHSEANDEVQIVTKYFTLAERMKALDSEISAISASDRQSDSASLKAELANLQEQKMALEAAVEKILERQVKESLAEQGIFNPVDRYIRLNVNFPPLSFKLEKPPHLLVVSTRSKIETMREITLKQDMSLKEMENVEEKVDELGVSSLVVELGGIATYPSFVIDNASLRFAIDTVTEEWLHQYLAFKPLGFLYLLDSLGVSSNYEIATMNETVADIVSREIGTMVCEKYYPEYKNGTAPNQLAASEFDYNREMRDIRKAVDNYLARGEIEGAEEFMEQKRQYLVSKGYYIRKLNQAYFAFHGTYADRPTSVSPIGLELNELRSQSASLKDFLNRAAAMTSRQDLIDSLK